jgi:Holliday junction DNA helicase RuvA
MYEYIKGTLIEKRSDYAVIENNGIGYKLICPLSTLSSIGESGSEVKVFTYHYVREDAINLYGFLTKEEHFMFDILLSVSGVGPKASISLVSNISPSKFSLSIVTNDAKNLTKAQGIGLKTAQRIILELKDKIKKESLHVTESTNFEQHTSSGGNLEEAISALIVLGYNYQEASKAVNKVFSEDKGLEELVRDSLKALF